MSTIRMTDPGGPAVSGPTVSDERDVSKWRRQTEMAVANGVTQFYRLHLGRGPEQARAFLIHDMIVVRQQNTLTAGEQHLRNTPEDRDILFRARRQVSQHLCDELMALVASLAGQPVVQAFSDTSIQGDRIDVFVLEQSWDAI